MNPSEDQAAFSARDMKVLRLLALALGIVTIAECLIAKSNEMLYLVVGLNGVIMISCPLAIYGVRRWKLRK